MTPTAPGRQGAHTAPPGHRPRTAPAWVPGVMGALPGLAVLAALVAAAGTGAVAAPDLADPGAAVRWGIPVVKVAVDASMALTGGALLIHVLAGDRGAARLAASAAGVWAVTSVVLVLLTVADVEGLPLTDPQAWRAVPSFLTASQLGAALGVGTLAAIGCALAARVAQTSAPAVPVLLAGVGMLAAAPAGHAAASGAQSALIGRGLHLVGASLWVGGLSVLVLLALRHRVPAVATVQAYSELALAAYLLVWASGLLTSWTLLGSGWAAQLASPYGAVLLGKAALMLALGGAGWWHRRRSLPKLAAGGPGAVRAFVALAAAELVVMALAMGLAVGLARSAPPVHEHAGHVISAPGS